MTGGVHRFRLAASPLLGVALGAGVLFFILVLGTIFGPDQSGIDLLVLAVSGLVLGGLALVALRLRKHKPVALEVGPSGIRLALWARALPWSDLREIRRERHFSPVGPGRDWLVLVLEEGARPPRTVANSAWLDRQLRRGQGLRVALHTLVGEGDEVVASVARFKTVAE